MLKLNIQKWGNSAAVRLPTSMLTNLGVKVGDALDVDLSDHMATLQASKPKYKLSELLEEMPNGMPMVEQWDALEPVGKEVY